MTFRSGTFVVTGAGSGIGQACARTLAEAGRDVYLIDRDETALARFCDELKSGVAAVRWRALDVRDSAGFEAVAAELAAGEPVAGVVNAAGVVQLGTILEISEDDWDHVVDINLKGVFLCCRAMIPLIAKGGGGAIVNLTSISGRTKSMFSAPSYVASKAGVIGLTMSLAAQHAGDAIRVNCVAPGIVDTPMLAGYTDTQREAMRAAIPLGRYASSEELAGTITFLLSEEAGYITGQTLNVNGGMFMQ
jgi:NAD(P)-dependent dehydrogenase (short-subunit alcohol dehydrogenase family)